MIPLILAITAIAVLAIARAACAVHDARAVLRAAPTVPACWACEVSGYGPAVHTCGGAR